MAKFFGVTQPGGVDREFPPHEEGDVPAELEFMDSVAREHVRLSGTTVKLHVLSVAAHRHPLYGEPSDEGRWEFNEVFKFPAAIMFDRPDDISSEATDQGKTKVKEAMLHVSRRELEEIGAPEPKSGDVVEFWGYAPFGDTYKSSFWDVVGADPEGEHWTQPTYTMLRFKLRWRSKFLAERKNR